MARIEDSQLITIESFERNQVRTIRNFESLDNFIATEMFDLKNDEEGITGIIVGRVFGETNQLESFA